MTSPYDAPDHTARPWHQRLHRELIWAIALKLVVLFLLKAAFFPHRLSASEAAQGLADGISSASAPAREPLAKEHP